MADINLEKKKGGLGWLLGLLAAAVVVGIVLFVAFGDDDDTEVDEQAAQLEEPEASEEPVQQMPQEEMAAGAAAIPIQSILQESSEWVGRTVTGEVAVASVPTDRGFWIEHEGEQLFVVLDPRERETPYEVEAEDRVRIESAMVHDRSALESEEALKNISEDTKQILQDQEVFLIADGPNVKLLAQR